jgi:hypothetical protein
VNLYIHFPIRLHDVVLNWISTGTTLPYRYGLPDGNEFDFNVKRRHTLCVWHFLADCVWWSTERKTGVVRTKGITKWASNEDSLHIHYVTLHADEHVHCKKGITYFVFKRFKVALNCSEFVNGSTRLAMRGASNFFHGSICLEKCIVTYRLKVKSSEREETVVARERVGRHRFRGN